jgi:hypothetical protein
MPVAVVTQFCTMAPNICGSSVWYLRNVTVLTPRILVVASRFREIRRPICNLNIRFLDNDYNDSFV